MILDQWFALKTTCLLSGKYARDRDLRAAGEKNRPFGGSPQAQKNTFYKIWQGIFQQLLWNNHE